MTHRIAGARTHQYALGGRPALRPHRRKQQLGDQQRRQKPQGGNTPQRHRQDHVPLQGRQSAAAVYGEKSQVRQNRQSRKHAIGDHQGIPAFFHHLCTGIPLAPLPIAVCLQQAHHHIEHSDLEGGKPYGAGAPQVVHVAPDDGQHAQALCRVHKAQVRLPHPDFYCLLLHGSAIAVHLLVVILILAGDDGLPPRTVV